MTPFRGAPWWEWDGFSGEDVRNSAEAFPFLAELSGAAEGGGLRLGVHMKSFGTFQRSTVKSSTYHLCNVLESFGTLQPFTGPRRTKEKRTNEIRSGRDPVQIRARASKKWSRVGIPPGKAGVLGFFPCKIPPRPPIFSPV